MRTLGACLLQSVYLRTLDACLFQPAYLRVNAHPGCLGAIQQRHVAHCQSQGSREPEQQGRQQQQQGLMAWAASRTPGGTWWWCGSVIVWLYIVWQCDSTWHGSVMVHSVTVWWYIV